MPYDPGAKPLTPEAALAGEEDNLERRQELAERRRRPNGRPKISIDVETAARAASIGCTPEEIATILGICRATFYNRMETDPALKEAVEHGRNQGRSTLRRLQWEAAQAGNPTMLIWLGKQLLGQRDKADLAGQIDGDIRVVVELVGEPATPRHGPQIEGCTEPARGSKTPS